MSRVPAAEQAIAVLQALADRGPSTATHLAAVVGMPRSSAYHLLAVLRDRGVVVHLAEDQRWALGPGAFEIGMGYLRHDAREALARPHLVALADATGETTHLGVLHGTEIVYLAKESPPRRRESTTLITAVGVRLPAALTASGRAILAHLPGEQVRAVMSAPRAFVTRTGRGPRSLSELRRVLAAERRQGYACEVEEVLDDYASVAAAVRRPDGHPAAAVSITVHLGRSRPDRLAELGDAVASTARHLSSP